MAALRTCTECPRKLAYADGTPKPAGTKTCTQSCRQKRARRQAREKRERTRKSKFVPDVQTMAAVTRGEVKDAIHEVAVEEIRPLVREAMTAEVLDSISTIIKLTPKAIEVLEAQMESEDETIAQRAATLFLKYTMGNPSVAPPPTEKAPAPMTVTFNIPRPGDTTTPGPEAQDIEDVEELRECTDCGEHKTDAEFVGASPRCLDCFDNLHDTLRERFAADDPTAPS